MIWRAACNRNGCRGQQGIAVGMLSVRSATCTSSLKSHYGEFSKSVCLFFPSRRLCLVSSSGPVSIRRLPLGKLVWTLHRSLLEFVVFFWVLDGIESELGRRSGALILECVKCAAARVPRVRCFLRNWMRHESCFGSGTGDVLDVTAAKRDVLSSKLSRRVLA